ncbi:cytochrome P450 4C1-like [Anthonomus grandis grandis]|uniref:cytochrome P450 4C1-like n=1 Tax=Anthonomus grandis grandis TaxID=2921223 RepID=UPI0021651A0F|nr:cytochrome P450 4C1-like [Anthonomus grandis grandis]
MLIALSTGLLKISIYLILFTVLYNVFIIVWKFRQVKFAWKSSMFFLPLIPFVGTAYIACFTKTKLSMIDMVIWCEKHFKGLPANFWFGLNYHYVTNNAEVARVLLNHPKCLNKAQVYDSVQSCLRNSLPTIPAEHWKPRRRHLRAAFTTNMIRSIYPTFHEQSCILLDRVKTFKPEDSLYDFFNKYVFKIFFLSSFGISDSSENHKIEDIAVSFDQIQDEFVKLFVNPVIPADIWKKLPFGAKMRELEDIIRGNLIEHLLEHKKQRNQDTVYLDDEKETTLVALLLDDGYKKESDSDLYNELLLFAFAATDTTGHTLAFAFAMLAIYPEIQNKAYEEIMSVIGDRNVEWADVQNLKYIDAILCETLRLMPTIPLFGRYCSEDVEVGDMVIPKGSNVILCAFKIQRNPEYWEDPLKFDPSRFFPENMSKIVPGSYLPFSIGARNCIGQTMAMTILKLTIASVLRSFSMRSTHKSVEDLRFESCLSMKTSHPLSCEFIPRAKTK